MNICDLPDVILEEIFSLIDSDEIPELMQVCPRFNAVISSSFYLMSTFTVQWKKSSSKQCDMRPLLASNRKYQRMQIEEVTGIKPNLFNFITKHASALSDVNFYDCSFKTGEFANAMRALTENLRFIGMCDVNFELDSEVKPLGFKNLEHMEIMYGAGTGYCSIMNFFTGAINVKCFTYEDNFEMSSKEVAQFSHFLESLHNLDNLSISYNLVQKMFLKEDFNNACKFKLRRLFVCMNSPPHRPLSKIKRVAYEHFFNFLDKQRATLQELNINRAKMTTERLEFLLNLNVHKLGMAGCDFVHSRKIFVQNETIRTLFLSMDEMIEENSAEELITCELLKNCAGVKNLHFTCTELTFEMALAIRNCKSNIESLELYRCLFYPLAIPSLKSLKMGGLIDHDETINLIRLNAHLKHLRVPHCLSSFPKFTQALQELNLESIIIT